MISIRTLLTAAVGAASLLTLTAASGSAAVVLKYGTEVNDSHPIGAASHAFAKRVDELSNGDIEIRVFTAESLGTAREMVEMLQLGTLDMTTVTAGVVANFAPSHDFFALPFLWENQDHLQRVVEGEVGDMLKQSLEDIGIAGLGYSTSGARQLYTTRDIGSLEDIKGLKVRTMKVPQIVETWKALGAIPVPVAFSEVYQALQTGVVDGAESSFLGWISQKHYEQAPKGYRINYIDAGRAYMMSQAAADRLSDEQMKIIQQGVDEMIENVQAEYREQGEAAAETAKKFGAEVIVLDTAPFREAVKPVYEQFQPNLGQKLLDLIESERQG